MSISNNFEKCNSIQNQKQNNFRFSFPSVQALNNYFSQNPQELKKNITVLVSQEPSNLEGDRVDYKTFLLQWKGESSPISYDYNKFKSSSIVTDVASVYLGEAHSISSGGQNIWNIQQVSKSAFTNPWLEVGYHGDENKRFVQDRPYSRKYGDLEFLEPVGNHQNINIDYKIEEISQYNQSILGLEFFSGEIYDGEITYRIKEKTTNKLVYKQTFNINCEDNEKIDFWFDFPVDGVKNDFVISEVIKEDGSFFKVKASSTIQNKPYRKLKLRFFEDLGLTYDYETKNLEDKINDLENETENNSVKITELQNDVSENKNDIVDLKDFVYNQEGWSNKEIIYDFFNTDNILIDISALSIPDVTTYINDGSNIIEVKALVKYNKTTKILNVSFVNQMSGKIVIRSH